MATNQPDQTGDAGTSPTVSQDDLDTMAGGAPSTSDIHITKQTDSASPQLYSTLVTDEKLLDTSLDLKL